MSAVALGVVLSFLQIVHISHVKQIQKLSERRQMQQFVHAQTVVFFLEVGTAFSLCETMAK